MLKVAAAICMVGILSGCGSIIRGTSEDVAINATPAGTKIQTSNGFRCDTSCVIKVPRRDTFQVVASRAGYQTETVFVDTEISGGGVAGVAGNVLLGGVIGIGVDTYNGAGLDHTPNPVNIQLEPNGVPQVPVVTKQPKPAKNGVPVS